MFDDVDLQILTILQDDARASNAAIARRIGMAPSAVLERIRKLEKRGAIAGYETRLAPASLGQGLLAFVFVRSSEHVAGEQTGRALAAIPEVQEVHHVAGEDCYLVKVRAAGPEALGRLLRHTFGEIPSVASTRSTIVLETLVEHSRLRIPASSTTSPTTSSTTSSDDESEPRDARVER